MDCRRTLLGTVGVVLGLLGVVAVGLLVLRNSEVCRQLWPDVAQLIHGEERTTVYP